MLRRPTRSTQSRSSAASDVYKRQDVNINQDLINEYGRDMKIVYTSLHGTGEMLARRALAQAGFDAVQVVEAQAVPHADFLTVKSPNPENQDAFAPVSYTHLRAHETRHDLVCRLLLEKKKKKINKEVAKAAK